MGAGSGQRPPAKKRLERAVRDLDERVARLADATLAAYERRRQVLIDDVAGDLPEDPEPRRRGAEDRP